MTQRVTYQERVAGAAFDLLHGDGASTVPAPGKRYSEFDLVEAWGESQGREVLVEVAEDVLLEGPIEVEVRRVWKGNLETFAVVSAGPEGLTLTGVEGNRYFVTGTGR